MPGNVGPFEIAVVLVIVLIIFGPKRLPELGRSLGKGIREFKGSINGEHEDDKPVAEIDKGEPEGPTVTATPVENDKPRETSTGS